jgi:dTDP-4-dehydrorhamnose 3,5-epimerase-like enzyme
MDIELIEFNSLGDDRGELISLEENKNIPFEIKRVYYLYRTKQNECRGFHAHKELKQVAIALHGSCRFLLDDGHEKREVLLDSPNKGILIESFIWREMFDFTDDCVLMVLADAIYDEADYIRDYEKFLECIE